LDQASGAKDYQVPLSIFEPDDRPDLIPTLCTALRRQIDESLRLSTLDDMLLRWAFTREANLQDRLLDAAKLKALVDATKPSSDSKAKERTWTAPLW
jgi:hypothetical protein